ncbi:MAG: hypothetical protein C0484_02605 [Rhodospirillum sp.]|nr:hypothetical protein [Rhodospirillum sp.]
MEDRDVDSLGVLHLARAFSADGMLKAAPGGAQADPAFDQLGALGIAREGRLERPELIRWIDKELARCQRMQVIHRMLNDAGPSRGAVANAMKFHSLKEIDTLRARMNDFLGARGILQNAAPTAQQVGEDGSIASDAGVGLGGRASSVGEKFGIPDFPEGYRKPGFT